MNKNVNQELLVVELDKEETSQISGAIWPLILSAAALGAVYGKYTADRKNWKEGKG